MPGSVGFICPYTVALSPAAAYISLSADYLTITVNPSTMTILSNVGTWSFTITATKTLLPVLTTTFNFNVIVKCVVTGLTITSQVPNETYILNDTSLYTAAFSVTQIAACGYPYTYTFAFSKSGTGIL